MPRNNKNAHKMLFMLQVENGICITDHNIIFLREILSTGKLFLTHYQKDKSLFHIKLSKLKRMVYV